MKKIGLFLFLLFLPPFLFPETRIFLYPGLGEVYEKKKGNLDSLEIPQTAIPSSVILWVDGKEKKEFFIESPLPQKEASLPSFPKYRVLEMRGKQYIPLPYTPERKWVIRWKGKSRSEVEVRFLTRSLNYEAVGRLDLLGGKFVQGIFLVNQLSTFQKCRIKIMVGDYLQETRSLPRSLPYTYLDLPTFLKKGEIDLGIRDFKKGRNFVRLWEGKVSLHKRFLWKAWKSSRVEWIISFPNPTPFSLPSQEIWLEKGGLYYSVTRIGSVPKGKKVDLVLSRAPLEVDKKLEIKKANREYLYRFRLTLSNESEEEVEGEVIEKKRVDAKEWESSLPPDWEEGNQVGWKIKIPPRGEKKILYRFLMSYRLTQIYERVY